MMTPQEVAGCTFAKAVMGGYNMAAVDDFLDKLTEDYSELYKENAALKAKLKVTVDKVEEYRGLEDAMRSTLLTAQKMAASMVAEAEEKRDAIISDTAGAAERRMEEIRQELAGEEERLLQAKAAVEEQIAAENQRLAVAQEGLRAFIQSVRSVCAQQLTLLEQLPELPVAEEPAEEEAAPSEEHDAQPLEAVSEDEVAQDIQSAIAAFALQEEQTAAAAEPMEDPFADDSEEEDDGATRVLNLDDLQFGRNYKRD